MNRSEELVLKAFLNLPEVNILDHRFELHDDVLAGYVTRFLNGERFKETFVPFKKEEFDFISHLININYYREEGYDLITYLNTVKLACNILNKYKVTT